MRQVTSVCSEVANKSLLCSNLHVKESEGSANQCKVSPNPSVQKNKAVDKGFSGVCADSKVIELNAGQQKLFAQGACPSGSVTTGVGVEYSSDSVLLDEGNIKGDLDACEATCSVQAGKQFWEVSSDEAVAPVSVKGRLRANFPFWKDVLHSPPWIVSTIESGYVLPLMSKPTPYFQANHASALQNHVFVGQSIVKLLSDGCVRGRLV